MNNRRKVSFSTLKRLLKIVMQTYKKQTILVIICILISSVATVSGSLFLKVLIDNYITPLLTQTNPIYTGLLKAIMFLVSIYTIELWQLYHKVY